MAATGKLNLGITIVGVLEAKFGETYREYRKKTWF